MQPSEQEIIQGIREGKQDRFQELFHAYYDPLCDYAFTLLRDMDEAEDLVQSFFLKLWENREQLNITQTVKSYLYRSIHNLCLNQLEHRQVRQKHQEHTLRTVSEKQSPDVFPMELENTISSIVEELPEQCRKIFKLSRYEEMKYAEIASHLGISVNTVENQISKALRVLRTQLNTFV